MPRLLFMAVVAGAGTAWTADAFYPAEIHAARALSSSLISFSALGRPLGAQRGVRRHDSHGTLHGATCPLLRQGKTRAAGDGAQHLCAQAKSAASWDSRPILVAGVEHQPSLELVDTLLKRSIPTRALVSCMDSVASQELKKRAAAEGLLQVVEGDIQNYESLVSAMRGCRACVSCSPQQRTTQLLDLVYKFWDPTLEYLGAWGPSKPEDEDYDLEDMTWLDPASTGSHPFNWALLAACNLRDAAAETGCPHIIRLSEAHVGASAWDPRTIARNARLSMQVKWQSEADRVLRQCSQQGVIYTIIRAPTLLEDVSRPPAKGLCIESEGEGGGQSRGWGVEMSVVDLAGLLAACAVEGRGLNQVLYCRYAEGGGAEDWSAALDATGYKSTPLLATLASASDAEGREGEDGGSVDGGKEPGMSMQEGGYIDPGDPIPAHTTAVLSAPLVLAGVVYAVAVQRGLAFFPPKERTLFNIAEVMPFLGLTLFFVNTVRASVMDKRPKVSYFRDWFK